MTTLVIPTEPGPLGSGSVGLVLWLTPIILLMVVALSLLAQEQWRKRRK